MRSVEKKNDWKKLPADVDEEAAELFRELDEIPLDDEEFKAVRPTEEQEKEKVLKPLFVFKKVYKRLQTDLLERDPMTAKRLLAGTS